MGVVAGTSPLLHDTDWARVAATDADSVELKVLMAPGSDAVGAVTDAVRRVQRRRIYLIDTRGARLARSGLVLRLRRLGRRRADVVVRSREHTNRGVRRPGIRVELDVLPGTILRTEQLGRPLDPTVAAAFCEGLLPADALLSDDQHRFLRRLAAGVLHGVPLRTLHAHGPLAVERMRLRGFWGEGRAFLERCTFPDGTRLEELSVRCVPVEAMRTAVRASRFLEEHGLQVADQHLSKTATWLEQITGETPRA